MKTDHTDPNPNNREKTMEKKKRSDVKCGRRKTGRADAKSKSTTCRDSRQRTKEPSKAGAKTKTSVAVHQEGQEKGIDAFDTSSSGPSELRLLQLEMQAEFTVHKRRWKQRGAPQQEEIDAEMDKTDHTHKRDKTNEELAVRVDRLSSMVTETFTETSIILVGSRQKSGNIRHQICRNGRRASSL